MPTVEYLDYDVIEKEEWDVDNEDNFERAAEMDLPEESYGTIDVDEGETILDAAEAAGLEWSYSCRAASCANCTAFLVDGEIEMGMQHVLSHADINEEHFRLTCVGSPATDSVKIVCNAKGLTPYW
ncbi:ferredoxin Fer [Halobellus sp. GM3]|uniref:ferredoxin Fer n=1 Tax=Halobellus sp. GM3 TaxID=3458410 RepID=UPI00403DE69B